MKTKILSILLILAILLPMIPAVYAAPTAKEAVSLNADYRYTLTGLPYGSIVQNFFIDDSTLYITQHGGNGITYLSRLLIQGDKAIYQDHMTLNNCGRGESLAGYYYNNKLYFYLGCKIDTSATNNYSTQIARVPYEAGKTYTYTQLNRFDHLNYATTDGSRLGTLYRNNVCANSQYTIFRVQTSEGTVTYACYDTKGLNELLDASQSVDLSKDAPRTEIIYSLTQSGSDQIVRPHGSFQGVELLDKNAIFTCGGAGDVAPKIGKLNNSGKYLCEATIANVGTASINGLQCLNGRLYFAIEGTSGTDGQMLYSIDLMNMGSLVSVSDSAGVPTLHQLPCVNPDTDKNDYQQNMSYVIRTGQGKTIVIDGGWSEYDGANLFSYLQKVTGQTNPHIDAWFLTHPHGDHYGVLLEFANKYSSQVTVDAFYHRMPTDEECDKYFYNANPTKIKNAVANILNKVGMLKDRQGNATRIVSVNPVHSRKCNSSFDFDDVHFDILMTVDDLFWGCDNITTKYSGTKANAGNNYTNETIAQLTADNLNNSSVVFRVTMGGKTILFLGDAAQSAGIMLKRYHDANQSDNGKYFSLKSDIVQIAHHGTNNVQQVVYQAIDPDIALWPTPKWDYAATADYSITQYYTRQWLSSLGVVDYVSGYGPQVLYFPTYRTNAYVDIPDKLRPYVFDAEFYAQRYPDLKAAYGTDEVKLYQHFIEYGIEEGRCASPFFDVSFYLNQNDYNLRYVLHGDYTRAFNHFINNMESTSELTNYPKQLSPIFDTGYYVKVYPELAAQGLDTEFELLEHFVAVGYPEHWLATDTVISADGTFYHQTCNIQQAQAPTCTESGYTRSCVCATCGVIVEEAQSIPATGHDYGYTDNGDGTHTEACKHCDSTATSTHQFTDGSCICGALESVETIVDETIQIYHTLNLASDIAITFAVPISALASYDRYYLECAIPQYEGNGLVGYSTVELQPVISGSYYYFTLAGITAVQMNDTVDAVLHMTKGGQKYISKTDSYSVATYAYTTLNGSTNAKMLTLCADLLRYGAEAQSYKGYRTNALADADMTDTHRGYLSDTAALTFRATDSKHGDLENPSITWVGKTLDLASKVGIKFVFSTEGYSGNVENLSLKVMYLNSNGEAKTVTLTGIEAYHTENGYYSFTFYGLLASELRSIVNVAVFEGDTQRSEFLSYSAETYASNTIGKALEPLCRALFAYSDSAKAYFTK